jgi:hypothetical protein
MAQGIVESLFGTVATTEERKREILKNMLLGGSSGMLDLQTLGFAPEKVRTTLGLAGTRPEGGVQQLAYDFGEGALPGAAVGSLFGGPVGAAGGGLLSGVTNVIGKQMFPEQPGLQAAVNIAPAFLSPKNIREATRAGARYLGFAPEATPAVKGQTGVTLTPGQVTGDVQQLETEAKVFATGYGAKKMQEVQKANQEALKSYAGSIQDIKNKNMSAEEIRNAVIGNFNAYAKGLKSKFVQQNDVNFTAARNAAGKDAVIDSEPIVQRLSGLYATYSDPNQPAEMQAIASKMKKIIDDLTVPGSPAVPPKVNTLTNEVITPGKPETTTSYKPITLDALQNNLSSWGKAAFGDTKAVKGALDGLAGGSQKFLARNVLDAYGDALDNAITTGAAGTKELTLARDVYKSNLQNLKEVAATPLFKDFGIDTVSAWTPEKAVDALQKATPFERKILISVLDENRPDVLSSLRGRAFEDAVANAQGDFGALHRGVRSIIKDERNTARDGVSDLEWLFPTKKEQVKLQNMFDDLAKLDREPLPLSAEAQAKREAQKGISEAFGSVLGGQGRYTSEVTFKATDFLRSDPKRLADAFTDVNYGKQGSVNNYYQNAFGTERAAIMPSAYAGAAGAGMVTSRDVNAPEEQQQLVIPPELEQDMELVIPPELQSSNDYEKMIRAEAERQGVGQYADQLVAMAKYESQLDPTAKSPKSSASGIFQLTKAAQQDMGVSDPFDPTQNIPGGVGYFKRQLDKFGDPTSAIAAFNQGATTFAREGFSPAANDYLSGVQRNM